MDKQRGGGGGGERVVGERGRQQAVCVCVCVWWRKREGSPTQKGIAA